MKAFVTGMGAVTAVGKNVDETWSNVVAGKHGFRSLENLDPTHFRTKIGAELPFDVLELGAEILPDMKMKSMIPSTQTVLLAAQMAMTNAGLETEGVDGARRGVCLGSGLGGIMFAETAMRQVMATHPYYKSQGVHPLTVPFADPNFSTSVISRVWNFMGPQYTVSTACSSSTHALGQALMLIQTGKADVVIAGGTEASILPLTFSAFDQMRAMSTNNDTPGLACRPFSADRGGFVMGDAAGVLIIESERHMEARGAKPLAELCGYGASGGGYHMVKPRPDSIDVISSMMSALQDADIEPSQIDCVNTHGTGTKLNDSSELAAINQVFSEKSDKIALMANKSNIGHTLGAAGAVEAILSVKAIQTNTLPPLVGFEQDEALDYSKVSILTEQSEQRTINTVISNSFGFGNNNASIVLRGV